MNPKHPAWWFLPILGILLGVLFRPSEELRFDAPTPAKVERRTLRMPDGTRLRFLRGPDMDIFLSETEVPSRILQLFQKEPLAFSEAGNFARWLSTETGETLRLPTAAEWRTAARAGVPNAEFAWGFGPPRPPDGVAFGLERPPRQPGKPFGYGFRDLTGGVWEWTAEGLLLGSAWSEVNPETLYLDFEWKPPAEYRGADTGVRVVWED
jgi:hypothetical protein